MGGLGNQLFQVSAALAYQEATGERVKFISRKKNPNIEELIKVVFPSHSLLEIKSNLDPILRRCIGALIRFGISGRNPFRKLVFFVLNQFANCLANYIYGVRRVVIMPQLDSVPVNESDKDSWIVGYFQNYITSESPDIRQKLVMGLTEPTSKEYSLMKSKMGQAALVIHIRLGDYVGESDFGILSASYYEKALQGIQLSEIHSIWVFSDSLSNAKKNYGHIIDKISRSQKGLQSNVYWIERIDGSDYTTWHLMKNGSAFVIGNSSYSWWAARLSGCAGQNIIVPNPWFNSKKSPLEISPKNWTSLKAEFLNDSLIDGQS